MRMRYGRRVKEEGLDVRVFVPALLALDMMVCWLVT
jgi:hypothetical protein